MKNPPYPYLSARAAQLSPYVAGLQPTETGWVKLNTNENPYPPSPKVQDALRCVDMASLRLYPNSDSAALCTAIAKQQGVYPKNVFCGNGSDEVLAFVYAAFFAGKTVMMPRISYGFYPVWCEMFDAGSLPISMNPDFSLHLDSFEGSFGVILANPNAPTGIALTLAEIEGIVQRNPHGVVVVDEAYMDFAQVESAVRLTKRYDNLLVVRTFSKSHSLAGLRVGYAIGNAARIAELQRVKHSFNSYPVDRLAQTGALAALDDVDYWAQCRARIIATRERTTAQLNELGFQVLPSQANFLFAGIEDAPKMYEHLYANKILVRHWDQPRIHNYLRITIGTDEEMEALLQCVKQY